jgi:hypothetical protein
MDATMLIHIAIDHEFIMRSLSWAVGTPEPANRSLSDHIRRAEYKSINRGLNDYAVQVARRWKGVLESDLPGDVPREFVRKLLAIRCDDRRGSTAQLPEWVLQTIPTAAWGGFVLNHTGRQGVEPWDGEVRSILLVTPKPLADQLEYDRHLRDLGVMLKCTAEANARRDAVVMEQVAQRLSFSPAPSTVESVASVAADALGLACEITGSQGGAVYLSSTSGEPEFERVAVREGPNFSYPTALPFGGKTTVAWSVDRHRAYQQIGGSSAAESLTRAVDSDGGTELVTPIAGPLADTWAPAAGTIVLFHGEGETRGYGAYERALVRNVALRLALFRTNIATREVATAISALRSKSIRRLGLPSPRIDNAPKPIWPRDISLAVKNFDEAFNRLAMSTNSHSVTLRIALSDEENLSSHGLALTRVAAYPVSRLAERYKHEREGDPGLHWEVMREGSERYVPHIEGDSRFPEARTGTKSVLCVPVRIEGVLAGTLNLESPFSNNYTPFLPLVVALAGAVGRTLADARAEIEGDVLDRTAQALARKHEYSGILTSMCEDLESVNQQWLKESLGGKIETLRTVIQDLREPEAPANVRARSLWGIVNGSLQHTELGAAREKPSEELFHHPLVPRAAQAITTVLGSVFRNVNYHSTSDGRDRDGLPVPRMAFDATFMDGAKQAVTIIENLSKKFLSPSFCAALYRYPVEGPLREIRLGTYIAGLNARRIGARIHATPIQEGWGLRTTLIIPAENLYDRAAGAWDLSYSGRG